MKEKVVFFSRVSRCGDYLLIRVPKPVTPMLEKYLHRKVRVTVEIEL